MPKHKTPSLGVDAVILVNDKRDLVLIRRRNNPFKNSYALPGGFVDFGERVEDACIREAFEETNIKVKIIKQIGVFSDPQRDPRGHVVSVAFLCIPQTKSDLARAKDDAAALDTIALSKISSLKLAFDHMQIIKDSGILPEK